MDHGKNGGQNYVHTLSKLWTNLNCGQIWTVDKCGLDNCGQKNVHHVKILYQVKIFFVKWTNWSMDSSGQKKYGQVWTKWSVDKCGLDKCGQKFVHSRFFSVMTNLRNNIFVNIYYENYFLWNDYGQESLQ